MGQWAQRRPGRAGRYGHNTGLREQEGGGYRMCMRVQKVLTMGHLIALPDLSQVGLEIKNTRGRAWRFSI